MMQHMTLSAAVGIARTWQQSGGKSVIDLAALEPLLWRDGSYRIADLVSALKEIGYKVGLTTNGHFLSSHAASLAQAGVDKVRISWHTTHPELFRSITSTGDYDRFIQGIESAKENNLPISINRVLLKPHLDDLEAHIKIVSTLGAPLKLYDLLWTPAIADVYSKYYVSAISVAKNELRLLLDIHLLLDQSIGRGRIVFTSKNGTTVEVKESISCDRDAHPCLSCTSNETCLEAFGDYVRFEPDGRLYFCYLRRDIGFDATHIVQSGDHVQFRKRLDELTDCRGREFLDSSRLRLIVVPNCNFNCGLPGLEASWCHKATGNFRFPSRRAVQSVRSTMS